MRREDDERTEQQAADHVGDRVGGADHESGRNECEPGGYRQSRAAPDVDDDRCNHDRPNGVPARIRVVERHDLKPEAPVRPVKRRTGEEVLADQLDAAACEPSAEPQERRQLATTTHEHRAGDHDDRA